MKPIGHWHWNEPGVLMHVPLSHGEERHSLISVSQLVPLKPEAPQSHVYVNVACSNVQVALFWHGIAKHGSGNVSLQKAPVKPGMQSLQVLPA